MPTSSSGNAVGHPRIAIEFDQKTWCPIQFADARAPRQALLTKAEVRYETRDGEHFTEGEDFQLISYGRTRRGRQITLRCCTESPHLKIVRKFVLNDDLPWLHVQYSLQSTGKPFRATATQIVVPGWKYGETLENPLEAEIEDYSFGQILADGYESPPYLTFWLKGRKAGFLLWTKNREMMRRMRPNDRELSGIHPALSNASSSLHNPEWGETRFQKPHYWDFYLWPVLDNEWEAAIEFLQQTKFRSWNPQHIAFPRLPKTTRATALRISVDDIARSNPDACAHDGTAKRWWHIKSASGKSLLYAQQPKDVPALKLQHHLTGQYRIHVVVHGGSGVQIQPQGTSYPVPLLHEAADYQSPFHNALLDRPSSVELDTGTWTLDGTSIELHPLPAMYAQTIIREIAFEPVKDAYSSVQAQAELHGIADAPDVAFDDGTPTDAPYRANVAHHAALGFKRIYWRADGQCCDFHTTVGTVRYPVRRVHNLFCPATLPYGLALRNHDLLDAAVEEGHKHGLEVFGYMRLNGFKGNVTAQFFRDHPELHDETEDGKSSKRMCYYLPEFRRWKVEIAREIIRHGVDGLLLDLTRSPPMVDYHQSVVKAYQQAYFALPPRNRKRGFVSYGVHELEASEEWMRWWRFRAEGFTAFGRELRTMLAEEGKPELPIHVQVRPKMALFDGFNLPAWLGEKLFDTLLVWPGPDLEIPTEIFEQSRERVPVRCTVEALSAPSTNLPKMKRVISDPRFEGLTIYESNKAVWSPLWREVLASF